jgi:type I restriction enzyme S subunit
VESGADLVRRILDDRAGVRAGKPGKGVPVEPGGLGDLPAVPGTWTWATLDQIGQEGRSVIYGIIKPGPDTPGGVPYVRVTEMKDGSVDMPSLRRAAREREAKFSRARLLAGDLLISKDGTIGRVAVVPRELEGGNITQHVMRAPIHRYMNREFVVWAIRSEFCQRWLTGETRGVALRGVNVEDFRRLPIPVPPRIEQDRIVAEVDRRLSIVREVEAEVDANLKRTQALRQAVLQKAFAFHVASETMAVA